MLDGLPIPAAEIARRTGEPALIRRANESFRALAGHDERLRGFLVADVPLLDRGSIGDALRSLFGGDRPFHQFETFDSETLGRRPFVVRLARLTGTDEFPDRCLLTLLDRSLESGPEQSFRPEPARDRLTGLANRRAFEERVADVLGHPNFEDTSHALLSVRIAAPDEEGAADEVLIAAARRLLSALRAGDLLARTGQASFAILMRLERGHPDATELAERLRSVLAAPFRLSLSEARVDSSVECAPLLATA
jgi:diguanylate cyclase (GGDEF)-like protein